MGCLQEKMQNQYEFNFSKEKQSKIQEFAANPELEGISNPALLDEAALLDDNTAVIQFSTQRNDIEALSKDQLLRISNRISRHAVNKLVQRAEHSDEPKKLHIDPALILHAIKSK